MKKKLFKYIKFLISLTLILSLIAPSYASLSASDGSAFVTKAEFDSALADFNSRLTTFEAGINSKIDSQVTSYLDRNGIWSGKEQDRLWGNPCTSMGGASAGKAVNWLGFGRQTTVPLIKEINKSGLMHLQIKYSFIYQTSKFWMDHYIQWAIYEFNPHYTWKDLFYVDKNLTASSIGTVYQAATTTVNNTGGSVISNVPYLSSTVYTGSSSNNYWWYDYSEPTTTFSDAETDEVLFKSSYNFWVPNGAPRWSLRLKDANYVNKNHANYKCVSCYMYRPAPGLPATYTTYDASAARSDSQLMMDAYFFVSKGGGLFAFCGASGVTWSFNADSDIGQYARVAGFVNSATVY